MSAHPVLLPVCDRVGIRSALSGSVNFYLEVLCSTASWLVDLRLAIYFIKKFIYDKSKPSILNS